MIKITESEIKLNAPLYDFRLYLVFTLVFIVFFIDLTIGINYIGAYEYIYSMSYVHIIYNIKLAGNIWTMVKLIVSYTERLFRYLAQNWHAEGFQTIIIGF